MSIKKKYSRKEILEKGVRYAGLALLGGVAGVLGAKALLKDKSCREYSRCESCKDTTNCSLATKKQFTNKWKNK